MYVLLTRCIEVFCLFGETQQALQATDQLVGTFEVDTLGIKRDTLKALRTVGSRDQEAITLRGNAAMELVREAVEAERYHVALDLCEIATRVAQGLREFDWVQRMQAVRDRIARMEKIYKKAQAAQRTLQSNPDNTLACRTAGSYLCFIREKWEEGLPLLAKCPDQSMQAAAQAELDGVGDDAKEMVAVAELWTAAARDSEQASRGGPGKRALEWLEKALPISQGLDTPRIKKKLEEIADILPPMSRPLVELTPTEQTVDPKRYASLTAFSNNSWGPGTATIYGQEVPNSFLLRPADHRTAGSVTFEIYGHYTHFSGAVAINESTSSNPSSEQTFSIYGDGRKLWSSRPMLLLKTVEEFDINIEGIKKLELRTQADGSANNAHCVWLNPHLSR